MLSGDAVSWAGEAVGRGPYEPAHDIAQGQASLAAALRRAEVIYPCHDRPFRAGPPAAYIDNYALRLRLFTDPEGHGDSHRQLRLQILRKLADRLRPAAFQLPSPTRPGDLTKSVSSRLEQRFRNSSTRVGRDRSGVQKGFRQTTVFSAGRQLL